jgi:rubrerythrin
MQLNTSASVISFAKQLEADSAAFYEEMAQRYPKAKEVFLTFSKENSNYATMVQRAYYGVITDAIEGCFAFSVETDKYAFATEPAEGISFADALNQAINMEQKLISFYVDAAQQSEALMADVPRTFLIVARKRKGREDKLRTLFKEP